MSENGLVSGRTGSFGTSCWAGAIVDTHIGSLGIGGAVVGETIVDIVDVKASDIPMSLFRCISKLPT